MLDRRAGSAIAVEDGTPVGIVTESDAMSRPLVTIAPDTTVRGALDRMEEESVKKFPVTSGLELVGIVTTTDIARHQPEAVKRAHDLERQRDRWEG